MERFEGQRRGWGQKYARRSADYRYEVKCPLCLRKFMRKQRNSKLRPHKDKFGNKCHSRRGYFV